MTQTRTKPGLREEAKLAMWLYYSEHKAWIPAWIREYREEIIGEIQAGAYAEDVFNEIIDRVETELVDLPRFRGR